MLALGRSAAAKRIVTIHLLVDRPSLDPALHTHQIS
jgi:hypothetical protein